MAAILGVLAVLGVVFSRQIIHFFTIFSRNSAQWDLAVFLNRIIFPAIFFIGLAAIAAAMLNSFQVFALPAATSIFFNLVLILFSLGVCVPADDAMAPARFQTPAVAIACAILLGGIIQFAVQIPALVRRGMRFSSGDFIQRSGRAKSGAPDGAGRSSAWAFTRSTFSWTRFSRRRRGCRREA